MPTFLWFIMNHSDERYINIRCSSLFLSKIYIRKEIGELLMSINISGILSCLSNSFFISIISFFDMQIRPIFLDWSTIAWISPERRRSMSPTRRSARSRSTIYGKRQEWSLPLESPWTRSVLRRTGAGSACRVEISTILSVAGLATVKVLPCRSGTTIFQNCCDDCVRPQPTHFAAGRCTGGRFPRSSHLRPSSAHQPWKKVQFSNKCAG